MHFLKVINADYHHSIVFISFRTRITKQKKREIKMMSTGNLILVLVLGGVFLIVVIWALFFWYRYTKMYNSSDDDDDHNPEAALSNNNRRNSHRVSLIRTFSCSTNRSGTRNNTEDVLLNNVQNGHNDTNNIDSNDGADSSLLPENTQISRLSQGPPSYQDLRGSFININENEDPPSYDDVHHNS